MMRRAPPWRESIVGARRTAVANRKTQSDVFTVFAVFASPAASLHPKRSPGGE